MIDVNLSIHPDPEVLTRILGEGQDHGPFMTLKIGPLEIILPIVNTAATARKIAGELHRCADRFEGLTTPEPVVAPELPPNPSETVPAAVPQVPGISDDDIRF